MHWKFDQTGADKIKGPPHCCEAGPLGKASKGSGLAMRATSAATTTAVRGRATAT